MDTWRDRLPAFLLTAAGVLVVVLLLVYRPDDPSQVVLSLSLAVLLLAMPVAAVLQAFGAPRAVVFKVLPVGVVSGGVLLVVGIWLDSPWALLVVVGVELATIAFLLLVALADYLWRRLVRRRRS